MVNWSKSSHTQQMYWVYFQISFSWCFSSLSWMNNDFISTLWGRNFRQEGNWCGIPPQAVAIGLLGHLIEFFRAFFLFFLNSATNLGIKFYLDSVVNNNLLSVENNSNGIHHSPYCNFFCPKPYFLLFPTTVKRVLMFWWRERANVKCGGDSFLIPSASG